MKFNRGVVRKRQVDTLIGICKGIIADGVVNQEEAEYLQNWLATNEMAVLSSAVIAPILRRVNEILSDGMLDEDEGEDLFAALRDFVGRTPEGGELLTTTNLPINDPEPEIDFSDRLFCFTGLFAFGSRSNCAGLIESLGGIQAPRVTKKLDYLVLGRYVTSSWAHEVYGRKIELAVKYRDDQGVNIAIVSEAHWKAQADSMG